MSLTFGLALYFIIWWTVLFAVLPFGVRTQGEAGEIVPGTRPVCCRRSPSRQWSRARYSAWSMQS